MIKRDSLRKIRNVGAVTATSVAGVTAGVLPVQAQGIQDGINAANTGENTATIPEIIQRIINVLLFVVGAASVIMLIIGGIRYVVSAGDQNAVTGAKNTILYALVGVGVALVAFMAVQFVFNSLTTGDGGLGL